jgi:hypothetical protein
MQTTVEHYIKRKIKNAATVIAILPPILTTEKPLTASKTVFPPPLEST